MTFLSPILLTGLVLAGVPILIHLLNRRRFRLIDWAPMKYLKLTLKTNRRRMRIEQFVLLAVRTLAVIALVLAVARPVFSSNGFGSWLGAKGRTARVIVIDDSLSMGYTAERASAFDAAKEAASQLLKSVRPKDSVTLLTTSASDAPILNGVHLDDSTKAIAAVTALPLTDTRSSWPAVFKNIERQFAAAAFPRKDLVLITDLRREGWNNEITEIANRLAAESIEVQIIDVGARETANLTLIGFDQQDPVALPGAPVNLLATIRNDGDTPLSASQSVLSIGGDSRPISLPELSARSTTRVPLTVTLNEAGQHPLFLKLPSDALPNDDGRWLNINVRAGISVTLVDGEPGVRPFESETDFLALAFSIGNVPWRISRQTDADWLAARPEPTDVIVLANLVSISAERVAKLEQLVNDGTGLIVFAGEQVDPQLYNDRLFKDGTGLLPARLEKLSADPVTGMVVESLDDSPLASLAKIDPASLGRIVSKRFMLAETPRAGASQQIRVLARWNDAESRPAVIEKKFGRGRVLLFTTTADRQWSDWPVDPTYVLAVRSAALAVARPDGLESQINAGEPIRHRLPADEQIADARVLLPGSPDAIVATVEKTAEAIILSYPQTPRAGVYTLKWKDSAGGDRSHLVTVNPRKEESDLQPISEPELADVVGSLDLSITRYTVGGASLAGESREIWKTLAIALLCLAAVETVLAVWVGRTR